MLSNKQITAIGLMSGTSLDGIDAAIIKTDGETISSFGESISIPYSDDTKNQIRDCISGTGDVNQTAIMLTEQHAETVKILLTKANLTSKDIDLIGFHGQTIKHDPDNQVTVQIGDGKLLAKLTGINVINDLRSNDVKNGGQGAPLVPMYHQALVRKAGITTPVAIVNIGGVSNVTYIDNENIIAFDTGPGNALIDDWVLKNGAGAYDANGEYAAQGEIDERALVKLINNPYFDKKPPKSLDRNEFASDLVKDLSLEDGAATLAAFTVSSIIMADHHFPKQVKCWYITGGGRHNEFIMGGLRQTTGAEVHKIDELGFNGDMLEAEAFAYLAVRSLYKLPLTLPTTTGVKAPVTGGVLNVA